MKNVRMVYDKLTQWSPTGEGRHSFTTKLADDQWSLALSADRVESLGCLVWELSLTRSSDDEHDLSDAAERFAGRAVGLLEPLTVHEVDRGLGEAILRSVSPVCDGESVFYYEACLNSSDRLVLRRYRASVQPGQRREQVAFPLTHEAVARLVDGLTTE